MNIIPHKYINCVSHTETEIKGFFGDYRYLSNMHPCSIAYEGLLYTCSEAAYMASKTTDLTIRQQYTKYNGLMAKQRGKLIELRANWETIKFPIMFDIVLRKFIQNKNLAYLLVQTGDRYIEETNNWGDTYWGVDLKKGGQNNLGKILMCVRNLIRNRDK